tara:strand:- start:48 stop:281 length:234 start_codon:yes stop_codon:yes gene_type:complete
MIKINEASAQSLSKEEKMNGLTSISEENIQKQVTTSKIITSPPIKGKRYNGDLDKIVLQHRLINNLDRGKFNNTADA